MLNQVVRTPPAALALAITAAPPTVTAKPGYYAVVYPAYVRPGTHLVRKDKTCLCELGKECPAIQAVTDYLRNGGTRAADVPAHHLIPEACPVCGGAVKFEPRLCSPVRGAGWICQRDAQTETNTLRLPGERHYWQVLWAALGQPRKEPQP